MKVVFIADLHFGMKIKDIGSLIDYQLEYLKNQFIPYLIENEIDTVIIPGDVSHNRKYIQTDVFSKIKENFFDVLEKNNINTFILPGNHDNFYTNSSDVHSGVFFENYKHIKVINDPVIVKFEDRKFLLTPWLSNEGEKNVFYSMLSGIDVIVGHFELNGFEVIPGNIMTHGDDGNLLKNKAQYIITGHYHNRSQKDNIFYIGTPYQMSWNEYGNEKGFCVLDTDTMKLKFINNDNNLYHKIYYKDGVDIDIKNYDKKICKVYLNELNEQCNKTKYEKFIKELDEVTLKYSVIDNTELAVDEKDIDDVKDKTEDEIFSMYVEANYNEYKPQLNKLYQRLKSC